MRQLAATLSLVFGFAACGSAGGRLNSPSEPQVALGEEFALHPGQTASLAAGALTVRLDSVSNDSRCPRGANCIWEGDALVAVSAHRGNAATHRHELHTSGRYAREVSEGPYRIELVKLDPLPAEGTTVDPKDYLATLKVARE